MLVFNGAYYSGVSVIGLRDVWALSLGATPTWTRITAPGSQHPGGAGGSAVYDPSQQRACSSEAGSENTSSVSHDVWALSLQGGESWAKAWTAQAPPATGRLGHSAIFDPIRRRMLVFGGEVRWFGEPHPFVNDLWALSLDAPYAWTRLEPSGPLPAARSSHAAIYDPQRDRMIVYGGFDGFLALGDVWALPAHRPACLATAHRCRDAACCPTGPQRDLRSGAGSHDRLRWKERRRPERRHRDAELFRYADLVAARYRRRRGECRTLCRLRCRRRPHGRVRG
jgi:hypothetical protein